MSQAEAAADTLLVNPALEDPEQHIGFRQEIPYGKTDKGEESIQVYGLTRESLNEARRKHLKEIEKTAFVAGIKIDELSSETTSAIREVLGGVSFEELRSIVEEAKIFIENAAKPSALFAGMTRSNFLQFPKQ